MRISQPFYAFSPVHPIGIQGSFRIFVSYKQTLMSIKDAQEKEGRMLSAKADQREKEAEERRKLLEKEGTVLDNLQLWLVKEYSQARRLNDQIALIKSQAYLDVLSKLHDLKDSENL